MQTMCMKKWSKVLIRKHFLPVFLSTGLSYSSEFVSNYDGKLTADHPILSLLDICYKCPIDLRIIHAYTVTSGLIRDTFVASRIVGFCFKSNWGDSRYARVIFDSIDRPDVYTWNAMIMGHAECDLLELGIAYYFRMLARRVPPDAYTFAFVVKACIMCGGSSGDGSSSSGNNICSSNNGVGRKMHGQILKHGMEDFLVVRNSLMKMYCNMGYIEEARSLFDMSSHLDLISWNSMISAYGKYGDIEAAKELFERMPMRSLVSWSAMIDGYVRSGSFADALKLFHEMQALGVNPDVIILVSVLKACANLGALDLGRWIHFYIDKYKIGREKNVVLGTALVDMYAKCGCLEDALELFHGIHDKDVILWNAVIGGLAMHGRGRYALEIFSRMKGHEVLPNATTFVTVLSACAHSGMVSEGAKIFESMKNEYKIEPGVEHYGCLADAFGRAGRVHEAEKVLFNMPMEPQASQLGALMAACKTFNNIEVGERVGKRLISLEPLDGGRYVLLSNMYAALGRWEDAQKTRRAMEEKGAKKEAGCSFIEMNGVIHEFILGNTSHPQSKEIYAMLSKLVREMRLVELVDDLLLGIDF